jgi:hypothetical protein
MLLRVIRLVVLCLPLLVLSGVAVGAPLSNCVLNGVGPDEGQTCSFYPEDVNGNFSQIGWVVPLAVDVVEEGFLYLVEPTTAILTNLLHFTPMTAQLFSVGCNSGVSDDISCWPVPEPGDAVLLIERSATDPTEFLADQNTYLIYSAIPQGGGGEVPEPATLGLLAVSLGFGIWRKRAA